MPNNRPLASYPTVLPSNASLLMRAVDAAVGKQLDAIPMQKIISQWNPYDCQAHLLAFLAWSVDVAGLSEDLDEARYRQIIAGSVTEHKTRGTVLAIRRAFAAIGFPRVTIELGRDSGTHSGAQKHTGHRTYGVTRLWWNGYRVVVDALLNAAQFQSVRTWLARITPVRCVLLEVSFGDAALHNNVIAYDAAYSHGAYQ